MGTDTVEQTHSPSKAVTVTIPEPTWRTRLSNWVFGLKPADRILQRRAVDLVDKLRLVRYLKPRGVYVDVGSGTGHNSAQMAGTAKGLGARFICVEPVSKPTWRVLRSMRHHSDGLVQFIRAVGNRLPLPSQIADGVSIFFVLHHIPYPIQLAVLTEIKRILRPGGRVFIWEDTPENDLEFKANEVWDRRLNFEPRSEAHYYRRGDDWRDLFIEHGFEVVDRVYYEDQSFRKKEGTIRHTGFVLQYGRPAEAELSDNA